MNTLIFALLCVVQSDWISTVTVNEPVAEVAEAPPVRECNCGDVSGILMAHEQDIQNLKAEIEELRKRQLTQKSFAPVDLTGIERKLAELQSRPAFTEQEIREFAKDEIKKFHATVRLPNGESKDIPASDMKVSVNGYAGTFDVPEGGVVTHINGVPVGQSNGWVRTVDPATNRTLSATGVVQDYTVRAVPSTRNRVRFFAAPQGSTCRIVNGVRICN